MVLFLCFDTFFAIVTVDSAQEKPDIKLLYHKQKTHGAEIELIIVEGASHHSLYQKDLGRPIRGGL
jgi:hypothetical protein